MFLKTNKHLRNRINDLESQLSKQETSTYAWKKAAEAAKKDLDHCRQSAELNSLTPDVKDHIEAAFSRGYNHARVDAEKSFKHGVELAKNEILTDLYEAYAELQERAKKRAVEVKIKAPKNKTPDEVAAEVHKVIKKVAKKAPPKRA